MQANTLVSIFVAFEADSIDDAAEKRQQIMRELAEYLLEREDVTEVDVEALR